MNAAVNAMNVYRRSQAGTGGGSAPSIQAYNISFSNITNSGFSVLFNRGNGDHYIAILRPAQVTVLPSNGVDYTIGQDIGSGNIVVAKGTATTFSVSGLSPSTDYHLWIFEANGTTYNTGYGALDDATEDDSMVTNPSLTTTVIYPTNFSGLQYWRDISQETGFIDGDVLQTITDRSGNGRHLIEPTLGRRATYKVNIQNGLPGLLFVTGQNYICQNGKTDIDFLHTGASTVIWVVQSLADNIVGTLMDSAASSAAKIGRTMRFITNSGNAAFSDIVYNGTGTTVGGATTRTGKATKNETHIIVLRYGSGQAGDDYEMYIDNVLVGYSETNSAAVATTASDTPTFFCNTAFGNYFNGYFFEDMAWNRRLTDLELNQLLGTNAYGLL